MLPQRQPRALFGNASFADIAGSELVIMEIAEHLIRCGWRCDVVAWAAGGPLQQLAEQVGLRILDKPSEVRPLTYDMVWLQNRLEPVLDYTPSVDDAPRTFFAFAHLDRKWSFAQPGLLAEHLLGEMFVVTSETHVERVVEAGLPRRAVRMIRNAAPATFQMAPPALRAHPSRILIVSNHPPAELIEAAKLLRARGVDVIHWGRDGDVKGRRLMPDDIAEADAVVTIGKTVPYALRARRAVYVYDHFGGPGWLSDATMATVGAHNFNGLCCERRLDGAAIAAEIMDGYGVRAVEAALRSHSMIEPFRLELFMDELLAAAATAPTPEQHRSRLAPHQIALRAERHLADAAGTYFGACVRNRLKRQALAEKKQANAQSTARVIDMQARRMTA